MTPISGAEHLTSPPSGILVAPPGNSKGVTQTENLFTRYSGHIRLLLLMYLINLLESFGRIAVPMNESKEGIVSSRQHHTAQDEQLYRTVASCKWSPRH